MTSDLLASFLKTPHFVDQHVGKRLRYKRQLLHLSQSALAEKLGITFQQIQKYERGTNRISASTLYKLSLALTEPVAYFFDGLPGQSIDGYLKERLSKDPVLAIEKEGADLPEFGKDTLEMIRLYYQIKDPNVRERLRNLLQAIVSED